MVKSISNEDENIDEFIEQDEKLPDKVLNHSKWNFSIMQKKTFESDYLKSRKWKYIYEEGESLINMNYRFIEKSLNKEIINSLIENIKKSELKDLLNDEEIINNKKTIGTLNSLEDLIMRAYNFPEMNEEHMKSDKTRLKKIVFKYRQLKKDGNSFYRGVIFNFLENVIFSKNILLMKEILILFREKITEENKIIKENENLINSVKQIDRDSVINILYIIIYYLEIPSKERNIELTSYIILLKAFLFCDEFDPGIVFFTRYLIYEYIKENENKFISEKKKEKIIDIISNINEFYKDLITMGKEANNSPIYSDVVPFIFNCQLDILIYRQNPEETFIKMMNYRNEKYTEYEINLIFREKDFDIFYKEYFYAKNYNELDVFIYNNKNDEFTIFSKENSNSNNELKIIQSRRISSQYPNAQTIKNFQISTNNEIKCVKGGKYIIKNSKIVINDKKTFNNQEKNEKQYTNDISNSKYAKLTQKKNTMEEKDLSESYIYNMIKRVKRGNNCYNKGCPNMIIKENMLNLCDDCKIIEIKSYILQAYLTYLQLNIYKNSGKKLKQHFSQVECPINQDHNVPLMDIISEAELDFNELFNKIRTNICLWCGNNIDEEKKYFMKLPCDCKLCSKNCFDNYIKSVDERNDKVIMEGKNSNDREIIVMPMTECPCGYEYKLKDFIYMIKRLKDKKLNSLIDIYEKQIKYNWKWICTFCRQNFSKKYKYIKIFFKDDKINKEISDKIELKHLVCKNCALEKGIDIKKFQDNKNNNKYTKKIMCGFCESEHTIEQIKNVNEENKIDSDCIIF